MADSQQAQRVGLPLQSTDVSFFEIDTVPPIADTAVVKGWIWSTPTDIPAELKAKAVQAKGNGSDDAALFTFKRWFEKKQ